MGCAFSTKCEERIKPTCDGFRDTPLRIFGYATHLGSACSALLPSNLSNVPHMITTAYICTDVFTKTLKASEEGKSPTKVAITAADAIMWQMLATVVIPGLIINKLKQFTLKATAHSPTSCSPPPPLVKALPASFVRALPCILGVLTLPLIMYPVDKAVTLLMDYTTRAILKEDDPDELLKKSNVKPMTKRNELVKN